jgi:hypothetical protein
MKRLFPPDIFRFQQWEDSGKWGPAPEFRLPPLPEPVRYMAKVLLLVLPVSRAVRWLQLSQRVR